MLKIFAPSFDKSVDLMIHMYFIYVYVPPGPLSPLQQIMCTEYTYLMYGD